MKGLEDHKNNILQNTNNCNQKKTINNLLSKHNKLKNCKTNKRAKKASTRRYSNNSETSQENKIFNICIGHISILATFLYFSNGKLKANSLKLE